MRRRLQPFGIGFEVEADDERVVRATDAALARFPRQTGPDGPERPVPGGAGGAAGPGGAGGPLRLRVRTGVDEAGDPAWPQTSTSLSADGARVSLRCGSARLEVDVRAGRAEAVLPPALLAVDDAVRMVVEGAFSALAINAGLLHAVHAGLVVGRGKGLLLRGPSGAGKSTLTYAALRAGFAVASDDWTYAVAGRRPDRLWGYPWRMFLVNEALPFFPELAGAPLVAHPGADRIKIAVEPPPARRRRAASLDAVVFLDPASPVALRPIEAAEAQRRFWDPALPTERSGLPPAWVAALLDRPTFVLQRGDDPHAAAAALQDLVRSLP